MLKKKKRKRIVKENIYTCAHYFVCTINENVGFTDHASGIQVPDCSKLVIS